MLLVGSKCLGSREPVLYIFFSHWRLGTMTLLGLLGSVDVLDNLQISWTSSLQVAYKWCKDDLSIFWSCWFFLYYRLFRDYPSRQSQYSIGRGSMSGFQGSRSPILEISGPQILVVPEKLWKYMKHKIFPSPISGRSLIGFVASFWGPLWNHGLNMIKSIAYAVA